MKTLKYKGKTIYPYESFYWNTTNQFFRGELGGGIARCVKCDDSLATLVMYEIKVQQVMNIVYEPQVLTPKRTDFGKAIRKMYENGEIQMSRHKMTKQEPRQDGISNTLTSVQKDNLIVEPKVINPLKGQTDNGWYNSCYESRWRKW